MDPEEILNPENGWLEDDTLSIEYGIYIYGMKTGNVRMLNFLDKPVNCDDFVSFEMWDYPTFYFPQFLLAFHSPIFQNQSEHYYTSELKAETLGCLVMAHGSRAGSTKKCPTVQLRFKTVETSQKYRLWNVVRLSELKLTWIFDSYESKELEENIIFASENGGLKFYLKHLLTMADTVEKLKEILKVLNLERMSSESLKTIASKIFSMIHGPRLQSTRF